MDTLALSRLQFAITSLFHFIFVPLSLGLSILIAYMETRFVATGDETYLVMAKFWGRLFLINFILGVVTGITMEFQFGMNWPEFSKYVGDIFGVPLAIESTVAFFLESVFIGLWVFGWDRISKKVHALSICLVAAAANLSALWILLANGWMQHPVGYILRNNRAEMLNFSAMLTNSYGWLQFFHTVLSGYVVAAFFVMGISAYHIVKKNHLQFFKASFGIAASFGFVSSLLLVVAGDFQGKEVAEAQPPKFAAMEAVWDTQVAAPYNLIVLPDTENERKSVEAIRVPNMLSFLAFGRGHAKIVGLKVFPKEDRPPVLAVFFSFRAMVFLGLFFALLTLIAFIISRRQMLESHPAFLKIMLYALPLPYIAGQLGWVVTEVGRQPWIVYGVLKTADAVSKSISQTQILASLTGFIFVYGLLAVLDAYLLAKSAKKGPEEDFLLIVESPATREV